MPTVNTQCLWTTFGAIVQQMWTTLGAVCPHVWTTLWTTCGAKFHKCGQLSAPFVHTCGQFLAPCGQLSAPFVHTCRRKLSTHVDNFRRHVSTHEDSFRGQVSMCRTSRGLVRRAWVCDFAIESRCLSPPLPPTPSLPPSCVHRLTLGC